MCCLKRSRSRSRSRETKQSRYFVPLHYQGESTLPLGMLGAAVREEPELADIFRDAVQHRAVFRQPAVAEDSGSDVEDVTGNTPEAPSSESRDDTAR